MSATTPAPTDAASERSRHPPSPSSLPAAATARFRHLEQALRHPGVQVLSVDVFDTLLCRRVPKPTDAHLLLGETLAGNGALRPSAGRWRP